jgi:hypothetical protein
MKVRVYFCREVDPEIILKRNEISKQALNTIYGNVSLKIFSMSEECG